MSKQISVLVTILIPNELQMEGGGKEEIFDWLLFCVCICNRMNDINIYFLKIFYMHQYSSPRSHNEC
jgi:hypothetical protein